MEKQKNPGHQPERFEVYNELPNGKGFTIKGTNHIFIFNKYGGWYDQYHNYYNQDGQPQDPPSDDQDDYQLSNHDEDPYEDEFENQYGPSINDHEDDQYDEHPSASQIKHIQNIEANLSTLKEYPLKTPMRVDFSNFNYKAKIDQILKHFNSKVHNGILNINTYKNQQGKFNGEGYFVVKDVQVAQKLVKLEGQQFQGRQFYLDIQPVQDLLTQPVSKQQMGDHSLVNESDFQPLCQGQVIIIDKKTKAEKSNNQQKKKYLAKTKQQKQKQAKQLKESQQKKQKQAFSWNKYHAEVTMFPKKSSFRQWMTSMNFIDGQHYKSVEKVQSKDPTKKQATLQLRSDVFSQINNKIYQGKTVIFNKL